MKQSYSLWVKISVLGLLVVAVSACGSDQQFPRCDAAVHDPAISIEEFKLAMRGKHFHECIHMKATVYYESRLEAGEYILGVGNDSIGGIRTHFAELKHLLRKGDSIEFVGYVAESDLSATMADEFFNCILISPK